MVPHWWSFGKAIPSSMFLSPSHISILGQSSPICNLCYLGHPTTSGYFHFSIPHHFIALLCPLRSQFIMCLIGLLPLLLLVMAEGCGSWKKMDLVLWSRKEISIVSKGCSLRKKTTDFLIETQLKFKIRLLDFSLSWSVTSLHSVVETINCVPLLTLPFFLSNRIVVWYQAHGHPEKCLPDSLENQLIKLPPTGVTTIWVLLYMYTEIEQLNTWILGGRSPVSHCWSKGRRLEWSLW